VLETTLAALGHAHAHGIVHRDVKPENILVGSAGAVKLADFGIARAYANASARLTESGMTVGTPIYMAPEQAMNADIGAWTDLYSLGVVAYELFLGRPPFAARDRPVDVLLQHVNDPPPPPRELDPELDAGVAAWLERMLAKAARERPTSAQAAWEELENAAVRLLGALWRRDARLLDPSLAEPPPAQPLLAEPPPAEPPLTDVGATGQFITFEHRPPSRPPTSESAELQALHSVLPPPDDPSPATLQLASGDALTAPQQAVAPPHQPAYSLYSRGSRRRAATVLAVLLLVVAVLLLALLT
jgi:serine/threonine protein kinase